MVRSDSTAPAVRATVHGTAFEQTPAIGLLIGDDQMTEQVKRPEWCFILQGPGKGITMRDGTIVFAAQYQDPHES